MTDKILTPPDEIEELLQKYELTRSGKCSGKCCEDFFLPFSPEELEELYEKHTTRDIGLIYIMLIYKGVNHIIPETGKTRKNGELVHHWTCRFHDKENKKCKIYFVRPHFCRTFPDYTMVKDENGEWKQTSHHEGLCNCAYEGCTYKHRSDLTEEIIGLEFKTKQKNILW